MWIYKRPDLAFPGIQDCATSLYFRMKACVLCLLYCLTTALAAGSITLNAIVRDFTPSTSPDFEHYEGGVQSTLYNRKKRYFEWVCMLQNFVRNVLEGLVANILDQDGKPYLRDPNNHPQITRYDLRDRFVCWSVVLCFISCFFEHFQLEMLKENQKWNKERLIN